MAKPNLNISDNFNQLVSQFNGLSSNVGDLVSLNTTEDSDLVGAINSLYALIDTDLDFRNKISVTDAGGDGSLSYSSATGIITYTGPSASEVRAHISVTDAGGDGSLSYNSGTGVITYTGPSASEVRAHLSAGTAITFSSGEISVTAGAINTTQLTDDAVSRAKLKDEVGLVIYNSAGTALKTLYGAGS